MEYHEERNARTDRRKRGGCQSPLQSPLATKQTLSLLLSNFQYLSENDSAVHTLSEVPDPSTFTITLCFLPASMLSGSLGTIGPQCEKRSTSPPGQDCAIRMVSFLDNNDMLKPTPTIFGMSTVRLKKATRVGPEDQMGLFPLPYPSPPSPPSCPSSRPRLSPAPHHRRTWGTRGTWGPAGMEKLQIGP